jgi:hypothetical protein
MAALTAGSTSVIVHGRVSGNDDDDDDDDDSSDRERQDRCEVHRLGMWLRGDRGVSLACP